MRWLVEIQVCDSRDMVVGYSEVEAGDEISARGNGYEEFVRRCRYEPSLRRKMLEAHIAYYNCFAAEAVCLG